MAWMIVLSGPGTVGWPLIAIASAGGTTTAGGGTAGGGGTESEGGTAGGGGLGSGEVRSIVAFAPGGAVGVGVPDHGSCDEELRPVHAAPQDLSPRPHCACWPQLSHEPCR